MKKVVIFLLIVVLCCIGLVGCNTEQDEFVEAIFVKREYHPGETSNYDDASYMFKVWYSEEYFLNNITRPWIKVELSAYGATPESGEYGSRNYYAQWLKNDRTPNYNLSVVPNSWIYFNLYTHPKILYSTATIMLGKGSDFDNEENILKTYTINL